MLKTRWLSALSLLVLCQSTLAYGWPSNEIKNACPQLIWEEIDKITTGAYGCGEREDSDTEKNNPGDEAKTENEPLDLDKLSPLEREEREKEAEARANAWRALRKPQEAKDDYVTGLIRVFSTAVWALTSPEAASLALQGIRTESGYIGALFFDIMASLREFNWEYSSVDSNIGFEGNGVSTLGIFEEAVNKLGNGLYLRELIDIYEPHERFKGSRLIGLQKTAILSRGLTKQEKTKYARQIAEYYEREPYWSIENTLALKLESLVPDLWEKVKTAQEERQRPKEK